MCVYLYISKVKIIICYQKQHTFDSEWYMINILPGQGHKLRLPKVNWVRRSWDIEAEDKRY